MPSCRRPSSARQSVRSEPENPGLGALIGGIRKIREASGEVVVVCDRAAVLRLLHTTRFDRMVSVVSLVEDAHLELAGSAGN